MLVSRLPPNLDHRESCLPSQTSKRGITVQISLKTVYNNLDPEITNFAAVPAGYDAEALKAARKRVALAGYRLADELKRLVVDLR
jgi:hypothetical protein